MALISRRDMTDKYKRTGIVCRKNELLKYGGFVGGSFDKFVLVAHFY